MQGRPGRAVVLSPFCPSQVSLHRKVLAYALRRFGEWRWRARLGSFGRASEIARPSWILGGESIAMGEKVRIWRYSRIEALNPERGVIRIEIGDGTVIQPFVHIGAIDSVKIGKGVLMASSVYITDHDHDYSSPEDPVITNGRVLAAPVRIEDRAWLGERVTVLKGVTIGEGSIIGTASVVTRDVPAVFDRGRCAGSGRPEVGSFGAELVEGSSSMKKVLIISYFFRQMAEPALRGRPSSASTCQNSVGRLWC